MFITILYYVIIISGALFLATSTVRLIERLDHPQKKYVPHTKPAAHRRRARLTKRFRRAA